MIRYRAFRNTDPPALAALWNRQRGRAWLQPLTTALLEKAVFSKLHFDRHGLIVAEDNGCPVGFVHACFGGVPDGSGISTETGAINVVLAAAHDQREQIAHRLLECGEAHLTGRGARTLLAGCVWPAHGFYLGLYGGTDSPGVLESDAASLALFRSAGYTDMEKHLILQRPRAVFRPAVDRQQIQIRRQYCVESDVDPPSASWWEACTLGQLDRVRHRLLARDVSEPCGSVMGWMRERAYGELGTPAVSLMDLQIRPERRGQGLGTFLVGEALRAMLGSGASLVEVQVAENNQAALALFRKLGFRQVDRGWVLRKSG